MSKGTKRTTWNYEKDLGLIKALFDGNTAEGLAKAVYGDPKRWQSVHARLANLGLSMREGRQQARNGMTAEKYLATSPMYAILVRDTPAPVESIDAMSLIPIIMTPDGVTKGPAFYLYAAKELERTAEKLRNKAARMLEESMASRKAG